MPKLLWALLCREVITDSQSNLVSYINCLEEAQSKEFPVSGLPVTVATLWEREGSTPERFRIRIQLTQPGGSREKIFDSDEILIDKPRLRANVIVNVIFKEEGRYTFAVLRKTDRRWNRKAELPFVVARTE